MNMYSKTATYREYLAALSRENKTPRQRRAEFLRTYWGVIVFLAALIIGGIGSVRVKRADAYDYAGRPCYAAGVTGVLATRDGSACIIPDCDDGGFGCGFGA